MRSAGRCGAAISGAVPPGLKPADLPDSASQGDHLLVTYCTGCHALPNPRMHSAQAWPTVVAQMTARMDSLEGTGATFDGRAVRAPTPTEDSTLVAYLQAHALPEIHPQKVAETSLPGSQTFARVCSQCHALPQPTILPADAWPAIVDKMQQNHQAMGRRAMTDQEIQQIEGFLQKASSAAHKP